MSFEIINGLSIIVICQLRFCFYLNEHNIFYPKINSACADGFRVISVIDIFGNKDSVPYSFRAFFRMLRNPESDSEIMQSAGNFHDKVREPLFRVPQHVFDDAETFHAGDDMLRDDTDAGNHLIENLIFRRQFFSAWLFFRLIFRQAQ